MLSGGGMGDIKSIAENADNLIEIISKTKQMSNHRQDSREGGGDQADDLGSQLDKPFTEEKKQE